MKRLRARGLSFGMIADQIGVSKDQAIGKGRRLKLGKPHAVIVRKPLTLRPMSEHKRSPTAYGNRPHVPLTAYTAPPGRGCKYPHDDYGERIRDGREPFCDAPTPAGESWCALHRRRVFVRA